MKDKFYVWKMTLIACLIFGFGVLAGVLICNFNSITLEGYGYAPSFNALIGAVNCATSSNATSSNAHSNRATSSNATSSNVHSNRATPSNATSSNAHSNRATPCNATSANATSANATSNNAANKNNNNNNSTSSDKKSSNTEVVENEILKFAMKSDKAVLGEKVYLNIQTKTNNTSSIKLEFVNDNEKFELNVNSIFNEPYIVLPDNIKAGNYTLNKVTLNYLNKQKIYEDGTIDYKNLFGGKVKIDILGINEKNILKIDNKKIEDDTIEKIKTSKEKLNILLDCSNNTKVSSKIFEAVKTSGSKLTLIYNDNKMIFFGDEISNVKDIEFKVELIDAAKDEIVNKLINNGLVIKFPDNNELPGKALVSIKIDKKYQGLLNDNNLYLYFVNEKNEQLDLIQSDIEIKDDFAQFELKHNSSYVLSNNNLNDEIVSFLNNKIIYVAVIVLCVVLVVVIVVIIIIKKRKKQEPKIENEEVEVKDEE